jgi:hypothetical protein
MRIPRAKQLKGGSQCPGEDMARYVASVSDTGMRVARHAG